MKRKLLLCGVGYGALLAAMTQSAFADDLTVGNGTVINTPLETASPSNGSPGNITTESGSRVSVNDPGATLTLNADNTAIDISGVVEATAVSGGIGVHILGGYHGTFTSQGDAGAIINVTGSGTGNYGVLLDGNAPFVGNISLESGSSIILYGENSVGVAINAPLEGDLVMGSAIQATGTGTTGILVTSSITGSFTNSGAIQAKGTLTYTSDKIDPLSGSGIAIGASITSGFLNSGPVSASDGSTYTGSVINSSTAPALVIAPSVAGLNASNITIGAFAADSAGLNFSFINRGSLIASQNDTGISTTGVRIGETGTASFSVSLTNGLYNRGLVQSSSESDNFYSTSVPAAPANAVGLEIGNGVTVSPFTAPAQTVSAATWETTVGSGSTTTAIALGDNASDVDGIYNGFRVTVGGETRTITDYDVVTDDDGAVVSKTATLSAPLTDTPSADTALAIAAPTDSVVLGEQASEISGAYTGFTITTSNQTFVVSDYAVIYDPTTSEPTMKVAKIQGLNGVAATWATTPAAGDSVTITTSALFNSGSISASMGGSEGGTATALLIHPGGTLPSLTNQGFITASATTSDGAIETLSAIAINDLSGTLNTIVNYGRIAATATALDGGTEVAIAADLSHSTQAQAFSVLGNGEVTGDILFGSSTSRLTIEGNVTTTDDDDVTTVDKALVAGSVLSADGGALDIDISKYGTGGVLRTASTRANNVVVGSQGVVQIALSKTSSSSTPVIATTSNVTFSSDTSIELTPSSFLPSSGTYTLISTGVAGGLSFSDFGATSNLAVPFIFNGTFSTDAGQLSNETDGVNAQALYLSLTRKSATEVGLQGNAAAVYEPLMTAALEDNEFGSALLSLSSADEVNAAVQSAVPDIAGGMRALTIAMTDQATGVIGARQRSLLTTGTTRSGAHFWAQEFYNIVSDSGGADQPGFGGAGQGVALGAEWGVLGTGRYGVGYTFFSSQETERHPRDTKTNGDWSMLSAYAAWRFNNFYVAPQLNVGAGSFKSRRSITVNDTLNRSATAQWSGYLTAGGATAGYIWKIGNFQLIPTIAFDLAYVKQGAYEEAGGGGVGLRLEAQDYTSVRSFAGVIGQGSYAFSEGAFMPQLLFGWSHEFADDPVTIDGVFESSPGSPFHLVGPTLSANKIIGGMSFGYVSRNWSAGFNYDAAADAGSLSQSATVSLTTRF